MNRFRQVTEISLPPVSIRVKGTGIFVRGPFEQHLLEPDNHRRLNPMVGVTDFRIIGHVGIRFTRVEVKIDGRSAYVPVDWEAGTIQVKPPPPYPHLNLTIDEYNNFHGDLQAFIAHKLQEAVTPEGSVSIWQRI